jgi:DNA polymerase-1
VSLDDAEVHLVDTFDEAMNLKRWLGEGPTRRGKLAWDVETTGLSPERDKTRLVSFGSENTAYVLPIDWPLGWGALAAEVMGTWDGDLVGHNSPYDHSMCDSTFGVELDRRRIHDTRLMAHVLKSTGSLALKSLADEHVDPRASVGQQELAEAIGKKGGWTWSTIPWSYERYWAYGGLDTILTDQLDDVLRPRVMADAPGAYELELAFGWVAEKMERKGVRLDRPRTEKLAAEFDEYMRAAERWCRDVYGVGPGSSDKIAEILLRDGVELTVLTGSGNKYSLAKDVLKGIDHPLAKTVLDRRGVQKMLGYLTAYLGFADADDVIHPSINTVGGTDQNPFESGGSRGVRTGRSSMSDPNLQNVPTRTAAGKRIRQLFVPRPGNVWIKADLDQIEMRILTHLCQDPGMIEAFRTAALTPDGDFFVNMARNLFDDPTFQKSDPRRQFVKNSGYALIYGAGLEQFARTAGSTVAQAAEFLNLFDRTYPLAKRFIDATIATGRRRYDDEGEAYVRSPLTNRKHVAEVWRLHTTLVNYLIQGTAGEIMKYLMVLMDQAGLDEYMLFPVHDEIGQDVPLADAPDVLATTRDIMNNDTLLSVPITSTVEVGPSWGECRAA